MTESSDTMSRPELSVVVAVTHSSDSAERCVDTLLRASSGHEVEIILAGAKELIGDVPQRAGVRAVICSTDARGPRLLGSGISAARGHVVAVTEDSSTFASDWVDHVLEAHDGPGMIVGGAVEPYPDGSITYWAAYLFDYSQFMLPFERHESDKLAGTNISWSSELDVEGVSDENPEFWKTPWLNARRGDGVTVEIIPEAVVYSRRSWAPWAVMRLQYHQGRCYGGMRRSRVSTAERLMYAVGMIVLPIVLTGRIVTTVIRKKRHPGALLMSFPLLLLISASWSVGEFTGYLLGQGQSGRHVR